jgi:hypothetical protein
VSEPIHATVAALVAHLSSECALLTGKVLDQWPEPNKALAMPSATVTWSGDVYTPLQPWVLSIADASEPDEDGNYTPSTTKRVVGEHDFQIQIDIWARNKAERSRVMQQVFEALHPDPEVPGVRLQVEENHDLWSSYSLLHQKFDDSEASSQRQEWRAMLVLVAQCKAVIVNSEYRMITIENNLTTPDTIEDA